MGPFLDTYLVIVIVLLALAVLDLMVGVANDAVNFLSSAIGSKVAPFWVIMIIAALGVMAGVTLSSGMMEVARKGIFYPQYFHLSEIMIIFVAVMFQDILMLDMFNTFGLPTSTTVSIVFGLFGSALAISLIKAYGNGLGFIDAFEYINSANVIRIVAGILLSIVIAFVAGSFFQYISRLIFTFNYKDKFKRYGSAWGGFALTLLTFFIILKGSKGASFMTEENVAGIKGNLGLIFIYSLIGWTLLLQLLQWFTRVNVLKLIVLFGTFALAMAFAANDLVNFIGAPLAGLNAYEKAVESAAKTGGDIGMANMAVMAKKIQADTWILLLAGAIMVTTLFLSKKARSVTQTTLRLGRQEEGYERFESNLVARAIVRMVLNIFDFVKIITPEPIKRVVARNFDLSKYDPETDKDGDPPAFDLIRAAVILMVAAAIISIATYFKLPLSTTYVTFIVAMAAALPDMAWGRESAVYRVSGVITVIGGWFFTAMTASLVGMAIAFIIYYGGLTAIFCFAALVAFVLIRTRRLHKSREKEMTDEEELLREKTETPEVLMDSIYSNTAKFISDFCDNLTNTSRGLAKDNLKSLKKSQKQSRKINKHSNSIASDLLKYLRLTSDEDIGKSTDFVRTISALNEISNKLMEIASYNFNYVDNNHHRLTAEQVDELRTVNDGFEEIASQSAAIILNQNFESCHAVNQSNERFKGLLRKVNKNQLKRIRKSQAIMRRSMLYLSLLNDFEFLADQTLILAKSIGEIKHS